MFRISAITRVGLVAVACAAVAAPSALAKPPVKSLYGYAMSYTPSKATPKKAAKVQSVHYGYAMSYTPTKATPKKAAKAQSVKAPSSGNDNLRAGLSNAYTRGCQNGTISDRTMGGDNNNYEYYGDVCTVSVPISPSLALLAASDQRATTPTAGAASSGDNTNYEYYGSASGS